MVEQFPLSDKARQTLEHACTPGADHERELLFTFGRTHRPKDAFQGKDFSYQQSQEAPQHSTGSLQEFINHDFLTAEGTALIKEMVNKGAMKFRKPDANDDSFPDKKGYDYVFETKCPSGKQGSTIEFTGTSVGRNPDNDDLTIKINGKDGTQLRDEIESKASERFTKDVLNQLPPSDQKAASEALATIAESTAANRISDYGQQKSAQYDAFQHMETAFRALAANPDQAQRFVAAMNSNLAGTEGISLDYDEATKTLRFSSLSGYTRASAEFPGDSDKPVHFPEIKMNNGWSQPEVYASESERGADISQRRGGVVHCWGALANW